MEQNINFLYDMIETQSVSGGEIALQKKVAAYMREQGVRVTTDYAGNVFASVNEEAPFQILLTGHIDEIGFRVTEITEKGFLHVNKAGGIRPELMQGKRVTVFGETPIPGVFGLLLKEGKVREDAKLSEMYIDCGFRHAEEAAAKVRIGDFVTYSDGYELLENQCIAGRALDDKFGAFAVMQALLAVQGRAKVGVTAATTVGEETTMRGAYFAAAGRRPDLAIAVDVIHSSDYSGSDAAYFGPIQVGEGPVLVKTSASNPCIVKELEAAAKRLDLKLQIEVAGGNAGTDADMMTRTLQGVPTAVLSIPLRYMHSPSEVGSLKDLRETIDVLAEFAAGLDENFNLDPFRD